MVRERPPISEELQRRVRQHCGFACAICGIMPTEIEHIKTWACHPFHEFENLVLLCHRHHSEVTSGRLSKHSVKQAQANPFAKQSNTSTYSTVLDYQTSVTFGSMEFSTNFGNTFHPFKIFGSKPITISLGSKTLVSMNIVDQYGNVAVSIIENVFRFRPSSLWDVRLSGTKMKIQYGRNKTLLDISISKSMIAFETVRIVVKKVPVVCNKNGIFFPNSGINFKSISLDSSTLKEVSFFDVGNISDNTSNSNVGENSMFKIRGFQSVSDKAAWDAAMKFIPSRNPQ